MENYISMDKLQQLKESIELVHAKAEEAFQKVTDNINNYSLDKMQTALEKASSELTNQNPVNDFKETKKSSAMEM